LIAVARVGESVRLFAGHQVPSANPISDNATSDDVLTALSHVLGPFEYPALDAEQAVLSQSETC
jgi:hypothetical protein